MFFRFMQIAAAIAFSFAAIYWGAGELNGAAVGIIGYFGAYLVAWIRYKLTGAADGFWAGSDEGAN